MIDVSTTTVRLAFGQTVWIVFALFGHTRDQFCFRQKFWPPSGRWRVFQKRKVRVVTSEGKKIVNQTVTKMSSFARLQKMNSFIPELTQIHGYSAGKAHYKRPWDQAAPLAHERGEGEGERDHLHRRRLTWTAGAWRNRKSADHAAAATVA
jgi:hypothetical protein